MAAKPTLLAVGMKVKMNVKLDGVWDNYDRLMRGAMAEQILNRAKIRVNTPILKTLVENTKRSDPFYREYVMYHKAAQAGEGYISSRYYSRDKVTARMFTESGCLNLINLSDPTLKRAIVSRYAKGSIVCIDFSTFEFTIIASILKEHGCTIPIDVHTHTANLLGCTRDEAKTHNGVLFYGTNENVVGLCESLGVNDDAWLTYVQDVRQAISSYMKQYESYDDVGYVVNLYGRRVYPKASNTIFNSVVQSTGSDILIEAIISLDSMLKNKKAEILFHRFDSVYFDFARSELYELLTHVNATMQNVAVDKGIAFETSISLGGDFGHLKRLA